MTRILAFSDLHGNARAAGAIRDAAGEADLLLGAGDFCNARRGLPEAIALLTPWPCPAILVPGNAESAGELTAAAGGATVLHGTATTAAGLTVFGLGHAVPVTPFGAWSCDMTEEAAAAALAACDGCDILLLHSPPRGIADRTSSGAHVGSTAIRDAIARIRPRLALCGHIHDSWGAEGTIGPTRIVNLGPRPVWFAP